ncbi:MAG: DNA-directed RNA polymerase subunit H [Nanoarchaeota archaeon]|nr:DNA-directed RNA polymerase subunit H [Nanoarchaeota archaeon]
MKMTEKFEIQMHKLVPKHTKLSEEEAQKILEQFNIALRQLPKIAKSDQAIKDFDAKPGDVIKIERISPIVGKTNFYRVVINA